MANSNLPDPPLKHIDLITDLDAIDTSIAEGAQWLDRNAPVNGVADRKGFVGFCTGLQRFVDESRSAGHVPPNIHNMLTDLSEQLGHYTADYAEWCFEGVESGSDWQAYSYREHLQTAVTELRAETEVQEVPGTTPAEPPAEAQGEGGDRESGDGPRPSGQYVFCPNGDGWDLKFETEEGHFANSKGLQRIQKLLKQPDTAISGLTLCGGDRRCETLTNSYDKAFDRDALASINRSLQDIENDLTEAKANSDDAKMDSLAKKKEELLASMKRDKRVCGGPRSVGPKTPGQQARSAAWESIRNAIKRLKKSERYPRTAAHFEQHIKAEDDNLVYRPSNPTPTWMF